MTYRTSFKSDIKMITRDPILVLFFILPIFIPIVFRVALAFLTPIVYEHFGLDLAEYYGYTLSLVFLMTPLMLGTVAGFLMIDERDSRIQELISISPVGYIGYISNRLMLPFIGSIVYTVIAYSILNIYEVHPLVLLLICLLAGIQALFLGYLLYILAADKVQGLTFSKGFGIFNLFALADILNVRWFNIIARLTPFYWITKIVVDFNPLEAMIGIGIHILYLLVILRMR